jgi:hypothetical protein
MNIKGKCYKNGVATNISGGNTTIATPQIIGLAANKTKLFH